jgi:glyoxylase-like metal-dependent hydrolase (beta-lactamase superfamily II)
MHRRTAIKSSILISLSAFFSFKSLLAAGRARKVYKGYGFHRFEIGTLGCTIISDGHILFKPVQPGFAPDVSADKVTGALHDNFMPEDAVDLAVNLLVIKKDTKTILIDTGCGFNFGPESGWAIKNLAAAGINAGDITDIVLTHGHPDHLGGLLDQEGKLVFPNADIFLSKVEHDFWMAGEQDFSKSKLTDQATIQLIKRVARQNITGVKAKLRLFDDHADLLDCVKCNLVPGHTPGHTVVTVYSGNQELVHIADAIHSAVLVVAHPEWGFDGDTDFQQAIGSRQKLLAELAQSRKLVFSYHLPWPGLGHVRKNKDGYEWVQQTYALPDGD